MSTFKRHITLFGTMAVFAVAFTLYMLVLNFFEITFVGTANGAYKALLFHDWLHGHGYIEEANALYYPLLQLVSVVFSLETPLEIYYGIIAVNGFFASVLLAFLFHYFSGYLGSSRRGLLVAGTHFILGGYFTLATNNEDIFPAYTFFVIGILWFRDFLQTASTKKLVYSIVMLSLSGLMHWTIGIPSCIGLIVFFLLSKSDPWRERLRYLLLSAGIALILFAVVSMLVHVPLPDLIYPAKEANSLWVSAFDLKKVVLCILNIPFFMFSGTLIITSYFDVSGWVIFFWIVLLLPGLLYLIRLSEFRKAPGFNLIWQSERPFFLLLLLISLIGFGLNIYEQGYDYQFLAQPCFIFIYAFAFLLRLSGELNGNKNGILLAVGILALFFGYNTNRVRGRDKTYFEQFDSVKTKVRSIEKTVFVGSPFRVFHIVAQLKLNKPSDYHCIQLPSDSHRDYLLSNTEYVNKYTAKIREYEDSGYQVVLINILNKSSEETGTIFTGYDLSGKMAQMEKYFKSNYLIEKQYTFEQPQSTFYFLRHNDTHIQTKFSND